MFLIQRFSGQDTDHDVLHISERINREVLDNQLAEYGKQIVASVARQLQEEFGKKGFDEKTFAE